MYPYRGSLPRRCLQRALPGGRRGIAVDNATRGVNGRAGGVVEFVQRPAPRPGCPGGLYPTQPGHEPRKIDGRLLFIPDELVRIRLAIDPLVDRPRELLPVRGVAHGHRFRNPQR